MAPARDLNLIHYHLIDRRDGRVLMERWLRREDAERYNQLWDRADVAAHWQCEADLAQHVA